MKFKIDKYGYIWIEKFGRLVEQICPYHGHGRGCGDWCPHFQIDDYELADKGLKDNIIYLCNGTTYPILGRVEELIDERTVRGELKEEK